MKIEFEQIDKEQIKIYAYINSEKILIGHIFSKDSYSGNNSIQICGFDQLEGIWSCGAFNHSMDCCLKWNEVDRFLKNKEKK